MRSVQTIFVTRIEHGGNILWWDLVLDIVDVPQDEPAAGRKRIDVATDFIDHLLNRAKG